MDKETLEAEVRRLAPWHHAVDLPHGLSTHIPELASRDVERSRVDNLRKHVWSVLGERCGGSLEGLRVLDVACNAGGFSVEAARSGARECVGIDVVDKYLEQADLLKRALDLPLQFHKMRVEDVSAEKLGRFDVTFCFGILYHLEDPVGSMRKLADVTDRLMVVDTDLLQPRWPIGLWARERPLWMLETPGAAPEKDRTTGLWRKNQIAEFYPTRAAVEALLRFVGFGSVEYLVPPRDLLEKRYRRGLRGTFIAER